MIGNIFLAHFSGTKTLLNKIIDKVKRPRIPTAITLQSPSDNSADDEPDRKTAAILEIEVNITFLNKLYNCSMFYLKHL